jgi:hypothetical protein
MEIFAQKTDAELLARLEAAAKEPLTQDEIRQQRVSFVYSVVQREGMTREKVEDLLNRHVAA